MNPVAGIRLEKAPLRGLQASKAKPKNLIGGRPGVDF
jgi:hypothetical protein